jgi:hypothetical protein
MAEGQEVEKLANQYLQEIVMKDYHYGELKLQQALKDSEFEARADGIIFNQQTQVFHIYEVKSSTQVKRRISLNKETPN